MATEGPAAFISGEFHRGFVGFVSNGVGLVSAYREHFKKQKEQKSEAKEPENEELSSLPTIESANPIMELSQPSSATHPLPLPVILPQRRPGVKRKGFLRAYAPVLQNAGISQAIFLKFLDDFDAAARANPVFTVVSIAATIAGCHLEAITLAVLACVEIAAEVAAELQRRKRTNAFLDEANEEF